MTRLSCCHILWLLPHPLTPHPIKFSLSQSFLAPPPPPHPPPTPASCFSFSLPVCRRSSLLTGEGGRSQIILKQQSLVLCNHSILSALRDHNIKKDIHNSLPLEDILSIFFFITVVDGFSLFLLQTQKVSFSSWRSENRSISYKNRKDEKDHKNFRYHRLFDGCNATMSCIWGVIKVAAGV